MIMSCRIGWPPDPPRGGSAAGDAPLPEAPLPDVPLLEDGAGAELTGVVPPAGGGSTTLTAASAMPAPATSATAPATTRVSG